jgi:hypothetical protein
MILADLKERFARLESEIAQEKGDFALFALFLREEVPDRWDLIAAAPWAFNDQQKATNYFINKIKSVLGAQELLNLSRIVLVDPDHADVVNLNRAIRVEHGAVEFKDSSFSGVPVKQGLIITSKRPAAPVEG